MELSSQKSSGELTGRSLTLLSYLAVVAGIIAVAIVLNSLGIFRMFSGPTVPDPLATTVQTEAFRFGPEQLTVTAGQEINLTLTNADMLAHSFDIDALDIHVEMAAVDTTTVTFAILEPGEYQLYCGIPGHVEAGMVGTFVVEAP